MPEIGPKIEDGKDENSCCRASAIVSRNADFVCPRPVFETLSRAIVDPDLIVQFQFVPATITVRSLSGFPGARHINVAPRELLWEMSVAELLPPAHLEFSGEDAAGCHRRANLECT